MIDRDTVATIVFDIVGIIGIIAIILFAVSAVPNQMCLLGIMVIASVADTGYTNKQ